VLSRALFPACLVVERGGGCQVPQGWGSAPVAPESFEYGYCNTDVVGRAALVEGRRAGKR